MRRRTREQDVTAGTKTVQLYGTVYLDSATQSGSGYTQKDGLNGWPPPVDYWTTEQVGSSAPYTIETRTSGYDKNLALVKTQSYADTNTAADGFADIADAAQSSYTPSTDAPGSFWYRVVVTNTAEGCKPASVTSAVTLSAKTSYATWSAKMSQVVTTTFTVPKGGYVTMTAAPSSTYGSGTLVPGSADLTGSSDVYTFALAAGTSYLYRAYGDGMLTNTGMFSASSKNASFDLTETMVGSPKAILRGGQLGAADVRLNGVDYTGSLALTVGGTHFLRPLRMWQVSNDSTPTSRKGYPMEPDFHYTVVDVDGTDVITVGENGLIRANSAGTAIVLVTYDAMHVNTCGWSTNNNKTFSAIWPENTGVVVEVGADAASGPSANMTINSGEKKVAGNKLDAESDVLYYTEGSTCTYSFTPETGSIVTLLRPNLTDTAMTYTGGFGTEGVAVDGSRITLTLTEGKNIVRIRKDGADTYQVITVKKAGAVIENKTNPGGEILPGDTLDTTGLVVEAVTKSGSAVLSADQYTLSPTLLEAPGQQVITVTYSGLTASFEVTVKEDMVTVETTLTDGITQKNSRMTFDVFAKDADGNKLPAREVTVLLNGSPMSVNWDDDVKTSYTLKFTQEGENIVTVKAHKVTLQYTIHYVKAQPGEVIGQAVFAIEAFTLGGGYIAEPCYVDIVEGENAAQALDRLLKAKGFAYQNTGTLESGFYLSHIVGDALSEIDVTGDSIPAQLRQKLDESGYTINPRSDANSLGEFDYDYASGWMYCLKNVFPNVGFADSYLSEGDVVRVQFTLAYGSDIGGGYAMGTGGTSYYPVANKDALTRRVAAINAEIDKDPYYLEKNCLNKAYDAAMDVLTTLYSTQAEVDAALANLPDPPVGHQLVEFPAKAAACTEDGYTGDEVCKTCGETVKRGETIPATGHDYKDGKCVNCGAADPDHQPEQPEKPDQPENPGVKTGDQGHVVLWIGAMTVCALGAYLTLRRRKIS